MKGVDVEYLRIRNWEKFQHYKNRRPIWVKLYLEVLDDHELASQDYATRLLAMLLLPLAARCNHLIPTDTSLVAHSTSMRRSDVKRAMANLVSIGFLEPAIVNPASSLLAQSKRESNKDLKDLDQSYPQLVRDLVDNSLSTEAVA